MKLINLHRVSSPMITDRQVGGGRTWSRHRPNEKRNKERERERGEKATGLWHPLNNSERIPPLSRVFEAAMERNSREFRSN